MVLHTVHTFQYQKRGEEGIYGAAGYLYIGTYSKPTFIVAVAVEKVFQVHLKPFLKVMPAEKENRAKRTRIARTIKYIQMGSIKVEQSFFTRIKKEVKSSQV